ncbi:MFS transporter [Alkalimonas sp.]|uniref:MFS transporter n=1 Tax=Alkalimonas sp. TaxID=1872453 RepID=UPI00263A7817|nr:MFS transporter [Alkalimonas sp.]
MTDSSHALPTSDRLSVWQRWPKVESHGMAARVLLAFLATAGLFYVNIMPALVSGLIDGLGFSHRQAGLIASSNIYGAAIGALVAVFIVKSWRWKPVCTALLLTLISLDFLSMWIQHPWVMLALRGVHGCIGGLLVGIAFAVIARTEQVHKTFGMLLLVQFGLGGLGVMVLPPMVPVVGAWILFLALILFSTTALLMLPFLQDYPVSQSSKQASTSAIRRKPLLASILAVFLFQAANMGLYAYIIDLGEQAGLSMTTIAPALGVSAWLGILGSGLVILFSTRFGRMLPLFCGILITAIATFALHFSALAWVFWLANIAVGITWAFSIAYLLGICAEFDKAGQMAALGGFASKMGLASGPLIAALLLGNTQYPLLINVAVVMLIAAALVTLYPARLLDRAE